ncbi:MAG: DUF6090 family protein [Aequorivita sp.]
MIKFFRKIRQKALTENKLSKYLLYAIGEIILVVIGILIALSINNWNQEKSDRKIEKDYIFSLIEDAKTDLSNFNDAIAANEERIQNLELYAGLCFNYTLEENIVPKLFIQHLRSLRPPDFVIHTELIIEQGNRARFYYEVTNMYLFLLKEGEQKSLELIKVLESDTTIDQ